MRCIVVCLFGLFSSLAHAGAYDVDTVCGSKPQEKPFKTLCTEPLLSSARQLERAYWSALESVARPENYQDLRKELLKWKNSYARCSKTAEREADSCLNQSIQNFGAVLDSKFSESMDDTIETDELFESAKQALSSLDQQMAHHLESCRKNADEKLDTDKSPIAKIARSISKACYSLALDYVDFLLSEQEESALYLLKKNGVTSATVLAETEKRYGTDATEPFVLEKRADRKLTR